MGDRVDGERFRINRCIVAVDAALFRDAGDETSAEALPWVTLAFVVEGCAGARSHRLSLAETRSLATALGALGRGAEACGSREPAFFSSDAAEGGAADPAPFVVKPAPEAARLTFRGDLVETYTLAPGHVDGLVGALEAAVSRWQAKPPALVADVRVGAVPAHGSDGAPRTLCVDLELSVLPGDQPRVLLFLAHDPASSDSWSLTVDEATTLASLIEHAGDSTSAGGALGGAEPWLRVAGDLQAMVLTFDDEMVREHWGTAFSLRFDAEDGTTLQGLLERAGERCRSAPPQPCALEREIVCELAWTSSDDEDGGAQGERPAGDGR